MFLKLQREETLEIEILKNKKDKWYRFFSLSNSNGVRGVENRTLKVSRYSFIQCINNKLSQPFEIIVKSIDECRVYNDIDNSNAIRSGDCSVSEVKRDKRVTVVKRKNREK